MVDIAKVKKIIYKKEIYKKKFFEIEEKLYDHEEIPYYTLNTHDYVSIFAETKESKIILVRQLILAIPNFIFQIKL